MRGKNDELIFTYLSRWRLIDDLAINRYISSFKFHIYQVRNKKIVQEAG